MKKQATPGPFAMRLATLITEHSARSRKVLEPGEVIALAKKEGHTVTWDDLRELRRYSPHAAHVNPESITRFLTHYIAGRTPQHILDPAAGIGSLLIPLMQSTKSPAATGISTSPTELGIARAMSDELPITWVQDEPQRALAALGQFDLVVASPPLGMPIQSVRITEGKDSFTVKDSGTYTLVLASARHLTTDGVGIFVLPNGFFFQQGKALARDALKKCRLYVNAVIGLPAGTFAPYTSIPLNLVFVSREQTPDLFVAYLAPGIDEHVVVRNFAKRTPGASVELGRLVPAKGFTGWQRVVATEEEALLAKRSGLSRVPLSTVVSAITLGKQTDDGGFENLPNCVYLPLLGTSPAVTSLSDLQIKPQNYAQLIVRPEAAHAEFLTGFFNSPLGRKTRDALLSGTFIPKISKTTLTDGVVYLLPLDAQQTAATVAREVHDLRLRLEQLERDLWTRPSDASRIRKSLSALNQKEGFASWVETLPFPLASILWRYHAAASAEHKVGHLFNAFEATAQFLGTLMASAFHSNQEFFRLHRHEWFERGKDNPHSLARSSFGEWVVRCQRLAKTTRQLLSDKDQREFVKGVYCTDAERIEALTSKAIYAVLESVSRYRNDWKGHSGIVGTKEYARRLAALEDELTRLRAALAGVFDDWWLLRPGKGAYTAGVHHYDVEKLVGSRQIFKRDTVETTDVLDANELYCYDVVSRRPLLLLHFVRMLTAPESEEIACYFYNRLEKNGVRWVSYHFEQAAARVEPDNAVTKLIDEVEREDT